MDMRRVELLVGAFVVFGIAAMLVLALKVSSITRSNGTDSVILNAKFENIGGLKVRSPVKIGGVVVGRISAITLDSKTLTPLVSLAITREFAALPVDTSAKINTAGLLGEQFISLSPGGEDALLKEGDTITNTQSALVLEDLISKYLFADKPAD